MCGGFGGHGIATASKRTTRLSIMSSASRGFSSPLPLIAVLASLMSGTNDLSCSAGLSGVGVLGPSRLALFQPFTRTSLTIHETPNRTPPPPIPRTQGDWTSAVNSCGKVDAPTRLAKTAAMPKTTISVLTSQCCRRVSFMSHDNAARRVRRSHRSARRCQRCLQSEEQGSRFREDSGRATRRTAGAVWRQSVIAASRCRPPQRSRHPRNPALTTVALRLNGTRRYFRMRNEQPGTLSVRVREKKPRVNRHLDHRGIPSLRLGIPPVPTPSASKRRGTDCERPT